MQLVRRPKERDLNRTERHSREAKRAVMSSKVARLAVPSVRERLPRSDHRSASIVRSVRTPRRTSTGM